jgi:hypothetical protein
MSTEMDEWIDGRREWSTAPVVTPPSYATTDHELAAAIRSAQNDLNDALVGAAKAGLFATVSVSETSVYGTLQHRIAIAIERKTVL